MMIEPTTNPLCRHCGLAYERTDKRQRSCRPCAELCRLQKLPHQIEAKKAYHRDYGERLRRRRGDKLFKGVLIACGRCGCEVITGGIAQKYCAPCGPIVTAERDRTIIGPKSRAKRGAILVGSDIKCPVCCIDFKKSGVNQTYCSAACKARRWSEDPRWTINRRMSAGVNTSLGDKKNGRSWESLVGFTTADLMAHLERQFTKGMSWKNRSEWHVDHRRPLSSFKFDSAEHPEFKAAWSLQNLQPLWAKDNLTKASKWTHLL